MDIVRLLKFIGGGIISISPNYIDITYGFDDSVRLMKASFPNSTEEDMILWSYAQRHSMDIVAIKRQYQVFERNYSSSILWTNTMFGNNKKAKPIRTQSELDNERLTEIVDAIVRYRKAEMAIPTEWIGEYNTIIERVRNNPK